MIWQRLFVPLIIAGLLQSGAASGQAGTGIIRGDPTVRFAGAPEVGEQIPDVTIVDDQGNPVNIIELASQSPYTVLTLGCLT
jgi:hypothetical protein